MSEQIEYHRLFKAFRKEERAETGDLNAKLIADLSSELPFYVQNTQNSIRIVGIDSTVLVDIFPKSQKYHDIKKEKRGRFEDCEKFVRSLF